MNTSENKRPRPLSTNRRPGKQRFWLIGFLCNFLLLATFAGLPLLNGCFGNGNPMSITQKENFSDQPSLSMPQAQLKISIKHSHETAAALRAATTARAVFELKLINYGNSFNPITLMRKSADVIDNQVSVSFSAVPVVSTIVSMRLEGATYNGQREFHAGIDLKPGENSIELVASGSADPVDVKAQAALGAINDYATMQALPAALFANLDTAFQTLPAADQTSFSKLLAAFKTRVASAKVSGLAAGESHSLILRDDGTLAAFGSNVYGQLGKSGVSTQLERKFVPFHQPITQIAAGADFSLLLDKNGKVYACGNNADAQLAATGISNSAYPLEVTGLPAIAKIYAGYGNALALDAAGNLYGWGRNNKGQMGLEPTTLTVAVPRLLAAGVVQAAVGLDFILLLKTDGTVWAMGQNEPYFVLAANIGEYSANLVQISGLSGITRLAAGNAHCLALSSSGIVYAWGSNLLGQSGLGATQVPEAPTQISGLSGIAQIEAGNEFSLFLTSTGAIWGTGAGTDGQLADKSTPTGISTPQQLAALSGVTLLNSGGSHSLAYTTETLAWGANDAGQCGNGLQSSDEGGVATPVARAVTW